MNGYTGVLLIRVRLGFFLPFFSLRMNMNMIRAVRPARRRCTSLAPSLQPPPGAHIIALFNAYNNCMSPALYGVRQYTGAVHRVRTSTTK
jgi:hypothetical protein